MFVNYFTPENYFQIIQRLKELAGVVENIELCEKIEGVTPRSLSSVVPKDEEETRGRKKTKPDGESTTTRQKHLRWDYIMNWAIANHHDLEWIITGREMQYGGREETYLEDLEMKGDFEMMDMDIDELLQLIKYATEKGGAESRTYWANRIRRVLPELQDWVTTKRGLQGEASRDEEAQGGQ